MNIGIVGATGQVGGVMLQLLADRKFPLTSLRLFASERSHYRGKRFKFDALSVANPDGNWLHLHKRPLRARTIAVAARDVCWKTDPRSALVLRRPSGLVRDDKNLEVFPFRFPQFPPHCIVVYQPGSGLMHLVVSECVDHPDIVSLDPNFDVLVFVNDRFWGYADNTGSFSLSVAVVDAL